MQTPICFPIAGGWSSTPSPSVFTAAGPTLVAPATGRNPGDLAGRDMGDAMRAETILIYIYIYIYLYTVHTHTCVYDYYISVFVCICTYFMYISILNKYYSTIFFMSGIALDTAFAN